MKSFPYAGIAIAGATASGKSALALRLAKALDGAVINADSAQVYADLRILSARPSQQDERQAPHALYGHVDGATAYSAAAYAREASAFIKKTRHLPILAGGTGLYFRALFEGLSALPPIPDEVRRHWREKAEQLSAGNLHALLEERDPLTAAGLRASDKQRVTRALEVFEATRRPLAEWQQQKGTPFLPRENWLKIVLKGPERAELWRRIEERFDDMMRQGAVEEVERLLARRLDPALPVMKAIGVKELAAYLQGETGLQSARSEAIAATRHYAKRQATWLRHQMPAFEPLNADEVFTRVFKPVS